MKFNNKKLTKKVKNVIKSDVLMSVAMVSILINVFFFSGILLFSATNRLDSSVFEASYDSLCVENYDDNLADVLNGSTNKAKSKASFEVMCQTGGFEQFYDNAVEAYLNDTL